MEKTTKNNIYIFILLEVIVAVVGAKPGAGPHHLLPFIPINAVILQNLNFSKHASFRILNGFKFAIICVILSPILLTELQFLRAMVRHYHEERSSATDLHEISQLYPGALLAPTDEPNYHTFLLNPILQSSGIQQLDVSAYMDLNFSGISDKPLLKKIEKCEFNYIITSKFGIPFSIKNGYRKDYLFSEKLRENFLKFYNVSNSHGNFLIFECSGESNGRK